MDIKNFRTRNYCFTSFENDGSWVWKFNSNMECPKGIDYIVGGTEVCPKTSNKHIQGYVEFSSAKTLSACKKMLASSRIHVEARQGTGGQASAYCKKDGVFFECGEISCQGKRTDLDSIRTRLVQGCDEVTIADDHFPQWCQYRRAFREYKTLKGLDEKRDVNVTPTVIFITGPTGCGKSRTTYEAGAKSIDFNGKFFLNYTGEKIVSFEDVDMCTFLSRELLLKLLDRYPLTVEIKGGQVEWLATTIYITSNFTLEELQWDKNTALLRRITEIRNLHTAQK